ncbi:Nucleolar complex-associated protein [Trema orientale]|uniref:Nucleolar complex-associated protein n=1 Tax=Trema orientale TaxID=63057 RepID=A0A2P5CB52_TREOI|nr:Nucleolar complex-associated protein [Trema orientale]
MGTKKKNSQKQKIILPPELPPEISEDEIEVSDEDLHFVDENRDYAGFVSRLDTQSITKHVTRVADVKEDALEALYEKRLKKKQLLLKDQEVDKLEVDPVDALPVKTLDGKLLYRTVPKTSKVSENNEEGETGGDDKEGTGVIKLTKAERRAKLKKSRKEARKQGKEAITTEVEQTPQAAVLAEVKEDITAEEAFENKKRKIAELGTNLLSDPESNIKSLKEFLQLCKDDDHSIVKLGLLSLLAVFKDIIPGYRIRLPTEKELQMKVSKDVKKMRYYESTLLSSYKAYLQKLSVLVKQSSFQQVAIRCICTLLDAVPHFNFRESLLGVVVRNISSPDEVVRKLCCSTIKSIFTNEGKHGGEATGEAVRLIADHVKAHNCQLHPDTIEVFLSLSFYEDLGRSEKADEKNNVKNKKGKKRKSLEEPGQLPVNDRKRSKQEVMTKMREEVEADYKSAAFTPDIMERRRMQTETLSAVFETYFRVLKHTVQPTASSSEANASPSAGSCGSHPLLAPCLRGLGKFSHLIDLDFMGDLISYLRRLASGGNGSESTSVKSLSVSERLQCCIVAFKVMKSNLEALNVDLQDFFVQLYNIILEYRPGRDQGEVLAEALKIMLCEDRQHDMQKAAAFVKRLATFSLCFGSAESMAALVTLKHLLQKNVKCRNLLENDAGGGSVSGSIAKYQPYASDPNLSGALASVLWELNLLSKHYHPAISTVASGISSMSVAPNQVYLSNISPIQAFKDLSLEQESLTPPTDLLKSNGKRKRGSGSLISAGIKSSLDTASIDEDEVRKKLSAHFMLLRDIKENQRLRDELDHATLSLQLYEEYKQQKRKAKRTKSKKTIA